MSNRAKRKTAQPPATALAPSLSTAQQIDRELAASAIAKRSRGEHPNDREVRALGRWERSQEEERRFRYYKSIPQRHWRALSGRQTKVLHEQADRYGIPFGGAVIDLGQVARALHDFLSKYASRLPANEDDPLLAGANSPALERYRLAKAQREELNLERDRGEWIRRDVLHDWLSHLGSIVRNAGETLQRQFGPDALRVVNEALEDFIAQTSQIGSVGGNGSVRRRPEEHA